MRLSPFKIIFLALVFLQAQGFAADPVAPPVIHCQGKELHIEVSAAVGLLTLCEQGVATKSYRVSLGSGGMDKKLEGDRKTPIGQYRLGEPKSSVRYPTKMQKRAGFTGGDVGVHGPDRDFEYLGDMTVAINWTAGCVALGYDVEINEIADWVHEKHPKFILIYK